MKKIFLSIIAIFFVFSNSIAHAGETGLIEDLLDLNYGPMEYELSLDNLKVYNFKNANLRRTYQTMVKYDGMIRNEIVNQYEMGTYTYETTTGIMNNYKSFIYYTNELFYFLNLVEKSPYLRDEFEVQNGILRNYKLAASYYNKTKHLIQDRDY